MRRLILATVSLLGFVIPAWADVPVYPPQNTPTLQTVAQAPNGGTINYSWGSGRASVPSIEGLRNGEPIRVNQFSRVSGGSGGFTGYKTNPVNLTDNYGNVARGQIQTQTNLGQTSTIAKAGAALYGAQVIGSAAKHQGPAVGDAIGRGDYTTAAQRAFEGVLQGMRDSGDSVLFGGISGVESAINAYQQAKNPNNAAEALAQAAAQKADQTAKRMQQQYEQSQAYQDYLPQANGQPKTYPVMLIVEGGNLAGLYFLPPNFRYDSVGIYNGGISIGDADGWHAGTPCYVGCDPANNGKYHTVRIDAKNYGQYRDLIQRAVAQAQPQPTIEDFLLTQAEAQNVLAKYMEQMLNDNNRNHTELMNALWAGGGLNPGNTQSMVMGSPGDNTFLTEPYTPVGSNQAQQTQFVVNKDGTVTQTIVQRPDLAANTSQAPTRAEVGQSQQQAQDTRQAKENSTAEKPDVCAQNPNSLMCAPVGGADYTDPVIPTQNVDMSFNPANIFSTDGVCPQPRKVQFQLGSASVNWEFSYSTVCDFSRHIRPLIIMCAMFMAATICYGAVKRL